MSSQAGTGYASSTSTPQPSPCKWQIQDDLGPFIQCEINQYGPKSDAYIQNLLTHGKNIASSLLDKAQSLAGDDIEKLDKMMQQIESKVQVFIRHAMTQIQEDIPQLETKAEQFLQDAVQKLDVWVNEEVDNIVHSLTPVLAWVVALLLAYQLIGGVFDTLPVSYRIAIALLVTISIPPKIRHKIDPLAAPAAFLMFGGVLLEQQKKK